MARVSVPVVPQALERRPRGLAARDAGTARDLVRDQPLDDLRIPAARDEEALLGSWTEPAFEEPEHRSRSG